VKGFAINAPKAAKAKLLVPLIASINLPLVSWS
jgi:hypothetical protein